MPIAIVVVQLIVILIAIVIVNDSLTIIVILIQIVILRVSLIVRNSEVRTDGLSLSYSFIEYRLCRP